MKRSLLASEFNNFFYIWEADEAEGWSVDKAASPHETVFADVLLFFFLFFHTNICKCVFTFIITYQNTQILFNLFLFFVYMCTF